MPDNITKDKAKEYLRQATLSEDDTLLSIETPETTRHQAAACCTTMYLMKHPGRVKHTSVFIPPTYHSPAQMGVLEIALCVL